MDRKEKKIHTIEEVNELQKWFKNHKNEIPDTMQIDSSAYTPNLKETIEMLFEQAYICYENPKMQGCIRLLKKIQVNIEDHSSTQ